MLNIDVHKITTHEHMETFVMFNILHEIKIPIIRVLGKCKHFVMFHVQNGIHKFYAVNCGVCNNFYVN